ncbi:hypothetical protein CG709_20650 [Lachnotalea glycerini]|nr:hypothetical protein CG709_20650 [Lachnotalea glycerini]
MIWKSISRFIKAFTISLIMALTIPSALPAVTSVTIVEAAVKLNKSSATIFIGKTLKLKKRGISFQKKVTWQSSNSKVAKVSSSGVVNSLQRGTVKKKEKGNKPLNHCYEVSSGR